MDNTLDALNKINFLKFDKTVATQCHKNLKYSHRQQPILIMHQTTSVSSQTLLSIVIKSYGRQSPLY